MKLKRISYKNFKCLNDIELELGKLTLLTGANSSGKSSVIHGLLGMLQTEKFPLYFALNGKYVNMGDFQEISYKHNNRRSVHLNFIVEDYKDRIHNIQSTWKNDLKTKSPSLVETSIESKYGFSRIRRKNSHYIFDCNYDMDKFWADLGTSEKDLHKAVENIFSKIENIVEKNAKTKKSKTVLKDSSSKIKFRMQVKSIDELFSKIAHKKNQSAFFQVVTQFRIAENFDENFNYISSFRLHPQRTYLQRTKSDYKVDRFGENCIDQILEWSYKAPAKIKLLNNYLRKIGLIHTLKPKQLKSGRYELRVKTFRSGTYDSVTDVGFGISQFLPIVVADLQLSKNSTLAVEQPEIHLHPKSQANFGDYLTDQINERQKQYIIETHSEYLLNRIRLNIVNGLLKSEDVAVYYLENAEKGLKYKRIYFASNGEIKNAPKSFFDTYMIDTMEIAVSAAR